MRDKIGELQAIRARAGKFQHVPSYLDVIEIKEFWESNKQLDGLISQLIPIRIVTVLEVFLRFWLQKLIDHGAPYVERAAKLNLKIKYDFAIAQSLQGGTIGLGELISHSASLSQLDTISATFGTVLGQNLFAGLAGVRDQWEIRQNGETTDPIIADVDKMRSALARLFEVRHILVHEIPEKPPQEIDEIARFLDAASDFIRAADWHFSTLLYGERALTQAEMTQEAHAEHQAAVQELEDLLSTIKQKADPAGLDEAQLAWLAFKEAEANRQTSWHLRGSIRPMIYHLVAAQLTRNRIDQLKEVEDRQSY